MTGGGHPAGESCRLSLHENPEAPYGRKQYRKNTPVEGPADGWLAAMHYRRVKPGVWTFRFGPLSPMTGERHPARTRAAQPSVRSKDHTSELQSRQYIVCRLLLEKKAHTANEFSTTQVGGKASSTAWCRRCW